MKTIAHGWISNPADQIATVIFVHGIQLLPGPCWTNGEVYWPRLLSEEEAIPSIGIYVFSYRADIRAGKFSATDAAQSLKEDLTSEHILDSKVLIFVCHSNGGIITRRFLVQNQLDLVRNRTCIGLFLVASPSLGSKWANLLYIPARMMGHSQAKNLRWSEDNDWLNTLDRDFVQLKESRLLSLFGKELVEDQPTVVPFMPRIVSPNSAGRYFSDWVKIPHTDHLTIATPADSKADQHRYLKTFITDVLSFADAPQADQRIRSLLPQLPVVMIGREELLKTLLSKLVPSGPKHHGQVVALAGAPGAGKSAIAACLAHDASVQKYYDDQVIWLSLRQEDSEHSESSEIRSRLSDLAVSAGLSVRDMEEASPTSNLDRSHWIRGRLVKTKLLLIVDDVWTPIQAKLLNVVNTRNGASVVFLSRSREVAQQLTIDNNMFEATPLLDSDAAELLSCFSARFVREYPGECSALIQAVAGLPLALCIVGSLLRSADSHGDLEEMVLKLGDVGTVLNEAVPLDMASHEGQTVTQLLELSMERMSEASGSRFLQLGIFHSAATFDLKSIAYLWGDSAASASKYIDELVDRSLLTVRGQGSGRRYSLHALLRAFALSKLFDIEKAELRHDEYFTELAHSVGPKIRSADYQWALSVLQQDRDKIDLALERIAVKQIGAALRAATNLADFWYATSNCEAGFKTLKSLLTHEEIIKDHGRRIGLEQASFVRALCACAQLAFFTDDSSKAEARALWREAGELQEAESDPVALALSLSGRLNGSEGFEGDEVSDLISKLRNSISNLNDVTVKGDALSIIGWTLYYEQGYSDAIAALSEAAEVFRSQGDNLGLIEALNGTVLSATEVGDYSTGEAAYAQSLLAIAQLGIESLGTGLHHNYGWMLLAKGDVPQAKAAFRLSQDLSEEIKGVHGYVGAGLALEASACIAFAESRFERSAKLFGAAAGHRMRTNDKLPEWMDEQYQPWIDEAKEALSNEIYDRLFQSGFELSDEQAMEYEANDEAT